MADNCFCDHLILRTEFRQCLLSPGKKKKIPSRQLPIEERDQGDSFIENLGELPGIVTLPFKIVFKGLGFAVRVIDYRGHLYTYLGI